MARHSLHTRAWVARLLREGWSYARVARETGVNKSTIVRWMKDPEFLNLVHGRGLLTLGHVQIQAPERDLLEQAPAEESWLWIGEGAVLGSLLVEGATHLRAAFISTPERAQAVREALEQQRFPLLGGERTCVLVPAALGVLQDDPAALALLSRICTGSPFLER